MTSTRTVIVVLSLVFASLATVSAHVVVGQISPTLARAFVSSPSSATDAPVRVAWNTTDTGLRVICFAAANTSQPRLDRPGWPRITAIGFELPGTLAGFSLVSPLDGEWELVEDVETSVPNQGTVTLDLALVARVNPMGRTPGRPDAPRGIPPGQMGVRGSGTQFCVSGPFPDRRPNLETADPEDSIETTIERLINGVVVAFHGVDGNRRGMDIGLWDNAARAIPLFP